MPTKQLTAPGGDVRPFEISWRIDVEATNYLEAIDEAVKLMFGVGADPENMATFFGYRDTEHDTGGEVDAYKHFFPHVEVKDDTD